MTQEVLFEPVHLKACDMKTHLFVKIQLNLYLITII